MHAKVVGQLGPEHIEVETGIERVRAQRREDSVAHGCAGGGRQAGVAVRIGNRDVLRPRIGLKRRAVGKLNAQRLLLPIAAHNKADAVARRSIVQHPLQLGLAHDGLAIHAENHVVNLDARLAGRSVVVDGNDFGARRCFEAELAGALGVDITQTHTQVPLRCVEHRRIPAGEGEMLLRGISERAARTEQALLREELWCGSDAGGDSRAGDRIQN